jgi:RNA ligase
MTTAIDDLLDPFDLTAAVEAGMVRVQTHPTLPLRIFNYTEQAVYTRTWTPVTRQCRGLIVDADGNVVARPWPKFFNYGEHAAGALDLAAPVEVTEKADGSLGILYSSDSGWAVATRGSFASEQATHATELYQRRYADALDWEPASGVTYLFEIVFPANRIVLDYGDMDDLILLGAVDIETGRLYGPNHEVANGWPGPRIDVHDHTTLAHALAAGPRPNAEGLVVRYLDGHHAGTLVKIKQDDYVSLHRVITGLTSRRLWERAAVFAVLTAAPETPIRRIGQMLHLDAADVAAIVDASPEWADEVRKTAPEEFTDWIDATLASLQGRAVALVVEARTAADQVRNLTRKEAAMAIADHPLRAMVFSALDGRDITAQAWATIRPEAEKPFAARSEDVA